MNKRELIERIKGLENIFGNKTKYIQKDAVIRLISELDEPQKVEIPIFVADWIEKCKSEKRRLHESLTYTPYGVNEWVSNPKNQETFARAWLDGYTVEKEKRYEVILCNGQSLKTVYRQGEDRLDFEKVYGDLERFTRKQLENACLGWVFDCPGVKVKEVE